MNFVNSVPLSKPRVNPNSQFLARGAYGCVYHPPPNGCRSCSDHYTKTMKSKTRNKSDENICTHGAVKLMDNVSAMEEKRLLDKIAEIDTNGQFHIKLEKICKAPSYNELHEWPKDKNGMRCSLKLGDDPMLLYFAFGGVPFSVFTKKGIVFKKRDAVSLANITRGLVCFSKKGFVHADTKHDNLMCKIGSNSSVPTVTKFIDFSWSFTIDTIPNLSSRTYVYWPPETAIVTKLHKKPDEYVEYVRNSIIDTLSYIYNKPKKNMVKYIDRNMNVINSIVSNMEIWTKDRKSFVNTIVRDKFDVFGFGVSLTCMLKRGIISHKLSSNTQFMYRIKTVANAARRFDATTRPTAYKLHRLYAWALDALK